jgi:hypothetical protein
MATKYNTIVETIDARSPAIADKYEYLGRLEWIPINVDASVQLVDSGDTIEFTKALPNRTVAVAAALEHNAANGLAASTTLQFKDSAGNVLSVAVATSTDTNGIANVVPLGNIDVSGKAIVGLVGGADWADTVDLVGYILVARNA